MRPTLTRTIGALLLATLPSLGSTSVPFTATLIAERDCPALQSIKKQTNPGSITLEPGRAYPVIAKNKPQATHYQIDLADQPKGRRWISVDCGRLASSNPAPKPEPEPKTTSTPAAPKSKPTPAATAPSGQYVLAASWQPAFCEMRRSRPECRSEAPNSPQARQFSLHGLWPQPRDNSWCRVSQRQRNNAERGRWQSLPKLPLSDPLRARLDAAMPGNRSFLHRYQWAKHGSCYGLPPAAYFRHSLLLLEQLNRSEVGRLFRANRGRHLRAEQIRRAADRSFGRGAGERVRIVCKDGMINELRLSLKGAIADDSTLAELMRQAPTKTSRCRGGRVDQGG